MNQWIWIALVALALLAGVALLVIALRSWRWQGGKKGKRLGVLERMPIARDAELVLVRRDGVEHLVCLSGGGGFLVEGGIRRPGAQRAPSAGAGEAPVAPVQGAAGKAAPGSAPHAEPKLAPMAPAQRKEQAPPPPPGTAAPAPRPQKKEPPAMAPEKANASDFAKGGTAD